MNFLRIAKEDIKGILKNRFIRVSIIAIIIVPLLYSLLYLYAFWDPYSKLQDIHVAVVNNDKGTVMDGERVDYGKDVEDELRNNNEIGWTITSEEEANSGLEGKGYYAKVVIPEDFSEKVTSAKEGKPETAKIQFVTNDKKNFLAAQINSKVQSELKGNITSKISSNYIEVAFDSLYEAKDGLIQAADGSKKLNDGLSTLNDKVPELANGANKLSDGSSQLVDGQVTLNNGINEVSNGSQALNAGLSQLYGKVPTLSSGVKALSNGASNLSNGVNALSNGTSDLSNGVNALSNGASDLSNGISIANSGSKQIADGSKALYNAYTSTIYPSVGQIKTGANQLNEALNAGQEDIAKLSTGATTIANKSDALSAGYNEIYNGVNTLVSGASDSANANANVMALLSKAASETDVNVKNNLINQALQITQAVSQKSQASAPEVQKLVEGNSDFKAGLDEYTTGSKALANGTNSLIGKVGQVQKGVGQLNYGLNQLSTGLDPSTSEFGIGLKTIADSTANLSNGLNTINTGASKLSTGASKLSTGASQLSIGVSQLSTGANKLNAGANELNTNIPVLSTGITDLYNGSTALSNGTKELSSGSNKLVDGQKQLNSGITELTSAVPELTDGVNKLYNGSKELSDKLGEGADKLKNGLVNSAKDMGEFASQAIDMNSEAINKIPNYGTGFAPYFMPLSLWIGGIMLFFVIPSKLKDEENLSNFDTVAGKYLSYAFVGILQALLVSTVVLILGLKPTNIGVYFLTNIFLSLVFIAIVQCFISLFGDAGRLLSIILLILQLTACAGTFPLEVLPKFFKILYPFMPFTYAVQALREVISADIINYSIVIKDILILSLMLILFLAISIALKKVGEKITSAIEGRKSDVAV